MVEGNYYGIFFDHAVLQADTQHLTTLYIKMYSIFILTYLFEIYLMLLIYSCLWEVAVVADVVFYARDVCFHGAVYRETTIL